MNDLGTMFPLKEGGYGLQYNEIKKLPSGKRVLERGNVSTLHATSQQRWIDSLLQK